MAGNKDRDKEKETKNHCKKCGKCCWDWKGKNPRDKCEHLASDLKTCMVYSDLKKIKPECQRFPTPLQACDLPEDCGYMIHWRAEGIIRISNRR